MFSCTVDNLTALINLNSCSCLEFTQANEATSAPVPPPSSVSSCCWLHSCLLTAWLRALITLSAKFWLLPINLLFCGKERSGWCFADQVTCHCIFITEQIFGFRFRTAEHRSLWSEFRFPDGINLPTTLDVVDKACFYSMLWTCQPICLNLQRMRLTWSVRTDEMKGIILFLARC